MNYLNGDLSGKALLIEKPGIIFKNSSIISVSLNNLPANEIPFKSKEKIWLMAIRFLCEMIIRLPNRAVFC